MSRLWSTVKLDVEFTEQDPSEGQEPCPKTQRPAGRRRTLTRGEEEVQLTESKRTENYYGTVDRRKTKQTHGCDLGVKETRSEEPRSTPDWEKSFHQRPRHRCFFTSGVSLSSV